MLTELSIKQDKQTVTPDGNAIHSLIEGVKIRYLHPIEDERGELMEVFNKEWDFHPESLVYLYQVRIRPKKIKGWVVHKEQDDRLFFCSGTIRVVLYDYREDSLTHQLVNDHVFSERRPALVVIPKGVFHALQNIGSNDAIFLNMPTKAYNYARPDKYRLPIKNSLIPFDFEGS